MDEQSRSDGLRHQLGLKSAYARGGEEQLPWTNYTPDFRKVIDYIWYGSAKLEVTGVLGEVDRSYMNSVRGLPNADFPSE
jgi:CCR4-NOT transcription complex subunit 6